MVRLKSRNLEPKRRKMYNRAVKTGIKGTGRVIDRPSDVGGWPVLETGEAYLDTDKDGMPDDWESTHGLNPADPADGSLDRDGDGYTNVEEFLNSLRTTRPS